MRDVLARVLRSAAARRGLTQKAVAERAGVHPNTVWNVFNQRPATVDSCERMARACGVDLVQEIIKDAQCHGRTR